jgi:hypothetical protein
MSRKPTPGSLSPEAFAALAGAVMPKAAGKVIALRKRRAEAPTTPRRRGRPTGMAEHEDAAPAIRARTVMDSSADRDVCLVCHRVRVRIPNCAGDQM